MPPRRRPSGEVENLKGFAGDAVFAEPGELGLRGVARGTAERVAGSGGQDVGGGHAAQIVDQLVEARVSDSDPVDIDHRHDEAGGAEQRGKRRRLDPRVDMGRGGSA